MTAKYTDKSNLGADAYLTSVIYDFTVMLDEILTGSRRARPAATSA